jgi:hypothetical protein
MTFKDRSRFVSFLTLAMYVLVNVFCMCPPVVAAGNGVGMSSTIPLFTDYDLDATTYTAVCTTGRMGGVLDDWIPGTNKIITSSSSTTTTSATSSTSALQAVEAGDELLVMLAGVPTRRYVTAAASVDSVTVNAAWTLDDVSTGHAYWYRNRISGTGAETCWIPVAGYKSFNVQFIVDQLDVTGGINFKLECRMDGPISSPSTIFLVNYTAVDSDGYAVESNKWDSCRVMIDIGSADDGADTTTHTEKLSAYFQGELR